MAPTCATLSAGLIPGLDWRPLHFDDPLPPGWACKLCGVVCKETVALPCHHTLCDVCFEGSVNLGSVCPLDGQAFNQDGADQLRLRPGQLLKLKAVCWNSALGCDFVGPVSELLDHFEKDCVHHSVHCRECHQDVPRLGLVRHRVSGSCDSPRSAEAALPNVTHQGGQLSECLGKASAEINQSISELGNAYYGLQTSVNTVADNVNISRSESRQAITEAVSRILTEFRTTQPDVSDRGAGFMEDLERANAEIKQSIAQLKDAAADISRLSLETKPAVVGAAETGRNVGPGGCEPPAAQLPELSSSATGSPWRFTWCYALSFKDMGNRKIESSHFAIDGSEAFLSLTWNKPYGDVDLRLHLPMGHPFQRPCNVRVVSAGHRHLNIRCQIDPNRLPDPRSIDLYRFAEYLYEPNQIDVYFEL